MSIDFDIMKWHSSENFNFPVACADAPDDFASVPWPKLRQLLLEAGARVNLDKDNLLFDFGNDGTLFISGLREPNGDSDDYILVSFNIYAYWTHVLDIYRKALELDSDLVLFDPQEAVFHNAHTFEPLAIAQRDYIRRTYET